MVLCPPAKSEMSPGWDMSPQLKTTALVSQQNWWQIVEFQRLDSYWTIHFVAAKVHNDVQDM